MSLDPGAQLRRSRGRGRCCTVGPGGSACAARAGDCCGCILGGKRTAPLHRGRRHDESLASALVLRHTARCLGCCSLERGIVTQAAMRKRTTSSAMPPGSASRSRPTPACRPSCRTAGTPSSSPGTDGAARVRQRGRERIVLQALPPGLRRRRLLPASFACRRYRNPARCWPAGDRRRCGGSAAQVANELAPVATVRWAAAIRCDHPAARGGQDVHYWLRETGLQPACQMAEQDHRRQRGHRQRRVPADPR